MVRPRQKCFIFEVLCCVGSGITVKSEFEGGFVDLGQCLGNCLERGCKSQRVGRRLGGFVIPVKP